MRIGVIYILFILCLPMYANGEEAFSRWTQEYRQDYIESFSTDSIYCPAPTGNTFSFLSPFMPMRSCRPSSNQRELLYNPELTEQEKKQRDDLICQCFTSGNTYEAASERKPTDRERKQLRKYWAQKARLMSDSEYANRVFGQGLGPAITSMNFADNSQQAEALAGVYLQYGRKVKDRDMRVLNQILNPETVSDEMCVPPREFIFHGQFPEQASFYEDLDKPFNPEDWDFGKLTLKLRNFPNLEAAEGNYEARPILERMKFLLHNPAYKAMFMSTDINSSANKVRLHAMLKSKIPRPECADIICVRTETWTHGLHEYQDAAREFLKNSAVVDDIQGGIRNGQKLGWAQQSVNTSDLLDNPVTASGTDWKNFCEFRASGETAASGSPLLTEIDKKYGIDFENISSNQDFINMNKAYCTIPRRDRNNQTMLFSAYRSQNCSRVNRRECLARFVQAYPYSSDNMIGLIYNINNILEKTDTIAQVSSNASANIATISQDTKSRRDSLNYLEDIPSHVATTSLTSSDVATVRPSSSQGTATAAPVMNSQLSSSQQTLTPEVTFQPQTAPLVNAPQRAEVSRENQVQGETQGQLIRNEISSLREVLSKPSERALLDNAELIRLRERLAELERTRDREISELPNDDSLNQVRRENVRTRSNNEIQGPRSDNTNSFVQASPQSAVSNAVIAPQVMSTGSMTAVPSSNSFSRGTQSSSGTKNNNSVVSQQGSITVASTTVDYQQLRNETQNRILQLPVTTDEFDLISKNNQAALSRYLDQVTELPVRLNFSSGGRTMEVYVLKSGELFFPGATSAVQRAPASVTSGQEFRLEDLRREFTN